MRTAYTSTVVGRGHVLAGVGLGLVALLVLRPWEVGLAAAVVLAVSGWWVGTVRLVVGPEDLRVALGPFGRSRRIPRSAVASATPTTLRPAQALGLGLPWRARTTRLTVRPGPALVVELHDGEVVRISTPDPESAVRILTPAAPARPRGESS